MSKICGRNFTSFSPKKSQNESMTVAALLILRCFARPFLRLLLVNKHAGAFSQQSFWLDNVGPVRVFLIMLMFFGSVSFRIIRVLMMPLCLLTRKVLPH